VNLDQALGRTAGPAMEAIDILREQPGAGPLPLPLGNGEMAGVRLGAQAGAADLGEVFPAQRRLALQRRPRNATSIGTPSSVAPLYSPPSPR